jgi:AcrR family transcriptional regulator
VYKSSQPAKIFSGGSPSQKRSKGEETKERIFQLALEYFNRNGIEYVGTRELARELGLSPGNVSYYFPAKEDFIFEIARRLSEGNAQYFAEAEEDLSIDSFIGLFRKAFLNHYKYRCLFVSFVHIMRHFPKLSEGYLKTQEVRRAALANDLKGLAKLGYLKELDKREINYLVAMISQVARFWAQEGEVQLKDRPIEKVMEHYAGLIAALLLPHATAKGRKQLESYAANVIKLV